MGDRRRTRHRRGPARPFGLRRRVRHLGEELTDDVLDSIETIVGAAYLGHERAIRGRRTELGAEILRVSGGRAREYQRHAGELGDKLGAAETELARLRDIFLVMSRRGFWPGSEREVRGTGGVLVSPDGEAPVASAPRDGGDTMSADGMNALRETLTWHHSQQDPAVAIECATEAFIKLLEFERASKVEIADPEAPLQATDNAARLRAAEFRSR